MSKELKPCPYCGSTSTYHYTNDVELAIACSQCGMCAPVVIKGSTNDDLSEAIHLWNILPRYSGTSCQQNN